MNGQSRGSDKRRSRKGCRTCRLRRVKCDEEVPVCRQCVSTGRSCEWFDLFNTWNPARASPTPKPSNPPRPPPTDFPDAKKLELRGAEFFRLRTAQEMCPTFEFGFWKTLVLQLSQSEPAILHATIALGTLHESEESLGNPISKDRMNLDNHRFAVSQYNSAIRILTERTGVASSTTNAGRTPVIILATCLIFTHIELLRGHYDTAITHIRSALKVLDDVRGMLPCDIEAMLRTAFLRLDLQSAHFDQRAPYHQLPEDDALSHLASSFHQRFETIATGKERYDLLSYHTFRLLRTCETNILAHQWEHLEDGNLRAQQQVLLNLHNVFIHQCTQYQNSQATTLLQMHARLTRILLHVSMTQNMENAFDSYDAEFMCIVTLAKAFVSGLDPSRLPSLSTDWGIVFPLVFTAMKCRNTLSRCNALAMLDSWHHREGFWDSSMAAEYARQIVKLEEPDQTSDPAEAKPRTTNVFADVYDDQLQMTLSWDWDKKEPGMSSVRNTLDIDI